MKEFVRLFEELIENEFEPWEREKKFQNKPLKFYPIDMDDGDLGEKWTGKKRKKKKEKGEIEIWDGST
ncbi:hypothetical protein ERO13_D07G098100v2 [Gossypium hirsutum]|uniref:Uncharacterized protein n=2 Tax=Gossypium TaxID=3633 RepID=A0A5D2K6Q8_GOSTO|nr:hypothetical protein ERO13_D07G098100v2 [Gossypium hirsutum]TYG60959.1 hypothetical protein ES288_D07G109500v1 [Gossypium darwinii]TYH62276.1 hypothetical protein ES332_D07G109300v1 [Gossypium tomentosum]